MEQQKAALLLMNDDCLENINNAMASSNSASIVNTQDSKLQSPSVQS